MALIEIDPSLQLLSELPQGAVAVVRFVVAQHHGTVTKNLIRRLSELGFLPGETVRVLRRVAGGEPIAVRVGSSTFALRRHEADCITVVRQAALPS